MSKPKSYYAYFGIRRPFRDFKLLDEYAVCPLGCGSRQLCQIGMMRDFVKNWKRCSYCFVKIPLPIYIQNYLRIKKPRPLSRNQQTLY